MCTAKNAVRAVDKIFSIKLLESPVFFDELEDVKISARESTIVECIAFGHPEPQIFWTFEGKKIEDGDKLHLNDSMKSGTYSCMAVNSEGESKNSFTVTIIAKLTLIEGFEQGKLQRDVTEGDEIKLICPFENYEKITWKQDGILLYDQMTSTLSVNKADKSHDGEYECNAINPNESRSFSYQVNVSLAPRFSFFDDVTSRFTYKNKTAVEIIQKFGQSSSLKCDAHGNPAPTIEWIRDGNIIGKGESFNIEDAKFTDAGVYVCEVKNPLGVARKTFTIKVQSVPYIVEGKEIIHHEKTVGESLTLNCNVEASPAPIVIWTRNK